MSEESLQTPSPVDDAETRAFISGWNAKLAGEHDFDLALHWWMRERCGIHSAMDLGIAQGRQQERTAVVAWVLLKAEKHQILQDNATPKQPDGPKVPIKHLPGQIIITHGWLARDYRDIADAIERGDHLGHGDAVE